MPAFRHLRRLRAAAPDEDQQIVAKQRVLMDNLERIGHVKPGTVLAPLVGDSWGYRRKGRFSVRRVEKKDKTRSASVNRTRVSSPTSASA